MIDVGLLCKLQCFLPRSSVLTFYKSFIRPDLDYGDVISDQPASATFFIKIESVQYNVALAIADAIRYLSHAKPFQELGLEYLHLHRCWIKRLCLRYKVLLIKVPKFVYESIPPTKQSFRNPNSFTLFSCRTECFKNSFLS